MTPKNILMVFDLSPVKITDTKAIRRNIYAIVFLLFFSKRCPNIKKVNPTK